MPIELMTGLPGTSKTSRLVSRMLAESKKPNPRPLVVMGVNGMKPGLAMILDDPTRWAEITDRSEGPCTCPLIGGEPNVPKPDGSLGFQPHTHRIPMGALVFVDEAWKWFGHLQDASRQSTPKHVLQLAEHRHMGIDFVWTTQAPAQIYPFARSQIGTHTHIVRKAGTKFCDTYTWSELQEDVKSDGKRAVALQSTDRMPTDGWEWFLSAQEHTIRTKLPKRVFVIPLAIIGAAIAAWIAYQTLKPSAIAAQVAGNGLESGLRTDPAQTEQPARERQARDRPMTPTEYAEHHLPRFATMPHTAPAFDGRSPTADPLLLCMAGGQGEDAEGHYKDLACTCMTEQGTRYDLPEGECRRVARWGQPYNPYKERSDLRRESQREREPVPVASGGVGQAPVIGGGVVGSGARPAAYGAMRASGW